MENNKLKGITNAEFYKSAIIDKVNIYRNLVSWSSLDYKHLEHLLNVLNTVNENENSKSTEKGKALEDVVTYVIDKSFFFRVYKNIKTSTNEIDQVVSISENGLQALHEYNISRDLIPISTNTFLCECKNYSKNLGVTWIGKFYGLISTCGCNFGIVFTVNGVTGNEGGWIDSYGLMKAFSLIEQYQNKRDFYIIEINKRDLEYMIEQKLTFFDIVKSKMQALKIGATYQQFLEENKHENEDAIKQTITSLML